MRALAGVLIATCVAVGAAGCAGRRPMTGQTVTGLDRKLSTFAWIEEGNLVTLIADARATRERDGDGFIPLEIAIANRGLERLSLSRESFTLIDHEGNRYPCVGPRDLLESYDYLDFDRRLEELPGIVTSRFAALTRYPSMFSPTRDLPSGPFSSTVVRDAVMLPKFGYLIDFIYFPAPRTGVMNQRFELFVEAPELPDPVFVKFLVH